MLINECEKLRNEIDEKWMAHDIAMRSRGCTPYSYYGSPSHNTELNELQQKYCTDQLNRQIKLSPKDLLLSIPCYPLLCPNLSSSSL